MKRELPHCLQQAKAGIAEANEPLDARDLATRLETEGVTDAVARADFGFPDTWSMAEAWLPTVRAVNRPRVLEQPVTKPWREYCKGVSFALPLLFSCLSIPLFGFALWGGALPIQEATAVGVGTIASFLLTGGIVQVMARRGLFFSSTKQFLQCEHSTWWWFLLGGAGLLLSTAVLLSCSSFWDWFPQRLAWLSAAFCVTLGFFWMATGILYFLNCGMVILAITVGGIGAVAILHSVFGVPLTLAQLFSIMLATLAAIRVAAVRLKGRREVSAARLPVVRWRDLFVLWPYFLYGISYYLLVFSDRIVAWTAHTQAASLPIEFRGDYENALNLGLFAFVFQVGWVQYSVVLFYRELSRFEGSLSIAETARLRSEMVRFYWRRVSRFIPLAIATSLIPAILLRGQLVHIIQGTAIGSLIGFPLLVVGLWNASLLFGLSAASRAAVAAGLACIVDVVFGYVGSRLGSHHHAVIGFVLGALAFAGLSAVWSLKALRRVDCCYYAASQ